VLFLGAVLQAAAAGLVPPGLDLASCCRKPASPASASARRWGGHRAGKVRRIVFGPSAHGRGSRDRRPGPRFIRRDSKIVIRRRYGVAKPPSSMSAPAPAAAEQDFACWKPPPNARPPKASAPCSTGTTKLFRSLGCRPHRPRARRHRRAGTRRRRLGRVLKDETLVRQAETTITDIRQSSLA
jgi:hypothetical protein